MSKRDHVLAFAVGEVRIATPSGSGLARAEELDVGCAMAVAYHRVTCMRVRAETARIVTR